MPGVRVTQGADFQIPAGAIRISLSDAGEPVVDPVVPKLRTDMWPQWLMEAVEAAQVARGAAAEIATLASAPDRNEEALDLALHAELRASMRTITASAFAIDAFYASVKARSPAHPHSLKWQANRTPRHTQVYEMLRYNLKLRNPGAKEIRDRIKLVFTYRNWAVHPGSAFRDPIYREDIDAGVDWHFSAFRSHNALSGVAMTVSMMEALVECLHRGSAEVAGMHRAARDVLDGVLHAYEAGGLPVFERAQGIQPASKQTTGGTSS
jgi:hypothetical protein